jgi:hypothetical protein
VAGVGLAALLFRRFGDWSAAFCGSTALEVWGAALAGGLCAEGGPVSQVVTMVPAGTSR